jgi:hypothetical protein
VQLNAEIPCQELGPPPTFIKDIYSVILIDIFHAMDRVKLSNIKHTSKKSYFTSLMYAFFEWCPTLLAKVKDNLRKDGMSPEEIEAKMLYDHAYFRKRVPRKVPRPSELYWRVRAVYAHYGNQKDSNGNALFNKESWKSARGVLKEILAGHCSDPPGYNFYTKILDAYGNVVVDKHGVPLLHCSRGTNVTEGFHKQFVSLFGTWNIGIEMSDYVLALRRHRYNQRVSEKRRLNFPKLGFYDTWLVEKAQIMIEGNHGELIFPDWSYTSAFSDTPETFHTVGLQSNELTKAVTEKYNSLDKSKIKLTSDQRYLAKQMKVPLPFLPVVTKEEKFKFSLLMKTVEERKIKLDYDQQAILFTDYVDGVDIFPKLPVHIRKYEAKWNRNQMIKEALKKTEKTMKDLNDNLLESKLSDQSFPEPQRPPKMPMPSTSMESSIKNKIVGGITLGAQSTVLVLDDDDDDDDDDNDECNSKRTSSRPIGGKNSARSNSNSNSNSDALENASTSISDASNIDQNQGEYYNDGGGGGGDFCDITSENSREVITRKRRKRTCGLCTENDNTNEKALACKGRGARDSCEYFFSDGTSKNVKN